MWENNFFDNNHRVEQIGERLSGKLDLAIYVNNIFQKKHEYIRRYWNDNKRHRHSEILKSKKLEFSILTFVSISWVCSLHLNIPVTYIGENNHHVTNAHECKLFNYWFYKLK